MAAPAFDVESLSFVPLHVALRFSSRALNIMNIPAGERKVYGTAPMVQMVPVVGCSRWHGMQKHTIEPLHSVTVNRREKKTSWKLCGVTIRIVRWPTFAFTEKGFNCFKRIM